MKTSLVFEQNDAPRGQPGRPPREAGADPDARCRVVVQMSEHQRQQLFAFAAAQGWTASDIVTRALAAMGVISE